MAELIAGYESYNSAYQKTGEIKLSTENYSFGCHKHTNMYNT